MAAVKSLSGLGGGLLSSLKLRTGSAGRDLGLGAESRGRHKMLAPPEAAVVITGGDEDAVEGGGDTSGRWGTALATLAGDVGGNAGGGATDGVRWLA